MRERSPIAILAKIYPSLIESKSVLSKTPLLPSSRTLLCPPSLGEAFSLAYSLPQAQSGGLLLKSAFMKGVHIPREYEML
jgi:hypothetical protein